MGTRAEIEASALEAARRSNEVYAIHQSRNGQWLYGRLHYYQHEAQYRVTGLHTVKPDGTVEPYTGEVDG